jgi:hypothetical protein
LLHRFPAPAETAFWVGQLDRGVSPAVVALGFTNSLEFRMNLIQLETQAYLHRLATPPEVNSAQAQLSAGVSDQALQAQILASTEYRLQHGNDALNWVNAVYQDVLGRFPDPLGQSNALHLLTTPASYLPVALSIVTSSEAHVRVVSAVFQQLLNRNPDLSGFNFWVTELNRGLMPSTMAALITASPEFIALFGGLDVPTLPVIPAPPPVTTVGTFTPISPPPLITRGLGTPFIPPLGSVNVFPAPGLIVLPFVA